MEFGEVYGVLVCLSGDLFYGFELILARAEANFFGMFDGVDAMLLFDAFYQRGGVVAFGVLVFVHKVNAGLVEGHRVGGGQYAHVLEFGFSRVAVAVAVDGDVVHHSNVQHFAFEIVVDCCCGVGHAFKEFVLIFGQYVLPQVVGILGEAV